MSRVTLLKKLGAALLGGAPKKIKDAKVKRETMKRLRDDVDFRPKKKDFPMDKEARDFWNKGKNIQEPIHVTQQRHLRRVISDLRELLEKTDDPKRRAHFGAQLEEYESQYRDLIEDIDIPVTLDDWID